MAKLKKVRGPGYVLREQVPGELEILETVLSRADRAWLVKNMRYFGIKRVHIRAAPHRILPSLALAYPCANPPEIVLSEDWPKETRADKELTTTHEFGHLWGLEHSRKLGFVSNSRLDTFTPKIMRDIKRGTSAFQPTKFGVSPRLHGAIQRKECPKADPSRDFPPAPVPPQTPAWYDPRNWPLPGRSAKTAEFVLGRKQRRRR